MNYPGQQNPAAYGGQQAYGQQQVKPSLRLLEFLSRDLIGLIL